MGNGGMGIQTSSFCSNKVFCCSFLNDSHTFFWTRTTLLGWNWDLLVNLLLSTVKLNAEQIQIDKEKHAFFCVD